VKSAHNDVEVEIVTVRTRAENLPESDLASIGVGVFTRELDDAVANGNVDFAVHSLKDMPSETHPELVLAAVPERESPLDAFISADDTPLEKLSPGAKVGTGSPRRKALLLAHRRDLEIVPLRGNVDTRLRKVKEQSLAGTILAHAGLKRLGKEDRITQLRRDDTATLQLLQALDDTPSHTRIRAERSFLRRLRGGCQVPAGALATLLPPGHSSAPQLQLEAVIATPDGSMVVQGSRTNAISQAEVMGQELADDLLDRGGADILKSLRDDHPS
jgi:hydroxymethylbilane synthase